MDDVIKFTAGNSPDYQIERKYHSFCKYEIDEN